MARKKVKGKIKKRLENHVDDLVGNLNVWGIDLDDPIVNARSRRITADGDFGGLGGCSLLFNFNKQANRLEEVIMSVDFYDFNATMVQEYKYSNYQQFGKVVAGSHKKRYENVVQLLANNKTIQKGIDLYETIPGVSDVNMYLSNYDTGEFLSFM